jgi:hypothetical protein
MSISVNIFPQLVWTEFAFLTMTNIRHFWVASRFLQRKFTIILNSSKNDKKSPLCGLISQTSAENPPKNGGVRKAN